MSLYQAAFPYISQSGTPVTGSFTIDSTTWTSATEIQLHDIPFETFGSGSGGIVLTGSEDITFSSYYPNLGPGSILFMIYSGSSWSYNIDTITDNTGYVTFDVTNLTGPAGTITPGISLVKFSIVPAGAGAQITNDANNRVLTATGVQGEINAETNLVFDGTNLGVGTDSPLLLAHFKSGSDAQILIESDDDNNIAGVLFKTEDTDTLSRVKGGIYFDNTGGDVWGRGDIKIALNNVASSANVSPSDAIVTIEQGGTVNVTGTLNADVKNFDIPHPSKEGWRLRYSVLEGPEYGVYIRGKLRGTNCIELPDYWKDLVYEDSITVHLTPFQNSLPHWLERIELNENKIYIGAECTQPSVDYIVYAERKFETPLTIEYKAEE